MKQDIRRLIIEALVKTLDIPSGSIIHHTDQLKQDLGLDSMTSLTFLMTLEDLIDGFNVDPDTLDDDALATVASITQYVERQLHANQA